MDLNYYKSKLSQHVSILGLLGVLILGFGVRLYKINNPVADWHSWRQADTASVSRNYLERGINLLYPTYHDISSIQTGIYNPRGYRFVEFPLYNAATALLAKAFPRLTLEVWSRLLSISASLVSIVFIYLLGNRFIDNKWGGVLAGFFFAVIPYNIYFSRVILPEPFTVAFSLTAIYLYTRFLDKNSYLSLYLFSIFFTLAMLMKPFVLFYLLPIIYLTWVKYRSIEKMLKDSRFLIAIDLALVPFFLWRAWVNQFPSGIPHWNWAFNGDKIRFRIAFWRWIFGERIGSLILGIWGLIPFSIGVLKLTKRSVFNHLFLLGSILYLIVFATATVRHDYYQVFLIPPISLMLAAGFFELWNTTTFNLSMSRFVTLFSVFMMLLMSGYQVKEFYKVNHPEIILAGQAVDRIAPKDALVIAPYNGDTAFLYQTKRWGWPVVEDSFDNLIKKGAKVYVSVNIGDADTQYLVSRFATIERTDKYIIIDLTKPLKK